MNADPVQEVLELAADGELELALSQVEQLIAEEPYQAGFIALRALLLADIGRLAEAATEARRAGAIDEQSPFIQWAIGAVALRCGEVQEAIAAAREAQALASPYSEAILLEARARAMLGQWSQSEALARRVVELEPGNAEAAILAEAASASLRSDEKLDAAAWERLATQFPFNATARAGSGWGRLEAGRARDARIEFEQALTLDPGSEWAREGLVLSLKARSPIYALLLRYFLWSGRLPQRTRNLMAIGGFLGYNFLRRTSRSNPDLAPLIVPVLIAYGSFVLLTWLADPLLNLTLYSDRRSRAHLSEDQRRGGLAVGAIAALGLGLGLTAWVSGSARLGLAALAVSMASLAAAAHYATESSTKRDVLGVLAVAAFLLGAGSAFVPESFGPFLFLLAILSAAGATWYSRFAEARPRFR
jgi:tetratricopeptide (TPR) repeat protein